VPTRVEPAERPATASLNLGALLSAGGAATVTEITTRDWPPPTDRERRPSEAPHAAESVTVSETRLAPVYTLSSAAYCRI
jgi:hypothetical protein